ncbi:MAG: hypothetical protein WAU70_11835 [Flavobacteriales bacterium]
MNLLSVIGPLLRDLHGLTMRLLALLLGASLFLTPLAQSDVAMQMVEECGTKLPQVLEEEIHKTLAPTSARLPLAPIVGVRYHAVKNDLAFLHPVRDVITPPPDRC